MDKVLRDKGRGAQNSDFYLLVNIMVSIRSRVWALYRGEAQDCPPTQSYGLNHGYFLFCVGNRLSHMIASTPVPETKSDRPVVARLFLQHLFLFFLFTEVIR